MFYDATKMKPDCSKVGHFFRKSNANDQWYFVQDKTLQTSSAFEPATPRTLSEQFTATLPTRLRLRCYDIQNHK